MLYKTSLGFEIQMVGFSKRAALCTGISVPKSLLLSALIGGGLAGLAGFNEVFGVQHRLLEGISGGNGYTAILVALLALNHPLRVMLVSIGLAALQVGAATMQRDSGHSQLYCLYHYWIYCADDSLRLSAADLG